LPRTLGPRFSNDQRRRLAAKGRPLGRQRMEELAGIVTPETLLRWHRDLIAKKYDGSVRRWLVDQPALPVCNSSWCGSPRTTQAGAPRGFAVRCATSATSWVAPPIKRILLDNGMDPAPARGKRMPWQTFFKADLGAVCAVDFFSVEVLARTGLVRTFPLFVIDLETRRVQIAGIVRQPYNNAAKLEYPRAHLG
jgi:putative transposase